jgi:hypothetical protein
MATTTNYGWTTPNDSDPFKQGASAIRSLGSAIDLSMSNIGQGDVSYTFNTTASLTLTTTTETAMFQSPSFTPVAGRLYEVTVTVGVIQKTTAAGQVTVSLRQNTVAGTRLDVAAYTSQPVGSLWSHTKTLVLTSTQMGTTAFVPVVTIQSSNNGVTAYNTGGFGGAIIIKDIGAV